VVNAKGTYKVLLAEYAIKVNRVPQASSSAIYNDCGLSQDFIEVEDTVRVSILVMQHGILGEAHNIGIGITKNFYHLHQIIRNEMHATIEPRYVFNHLRNYQYFTQAKIAKVMSDYGFRSELDLRAGVRKMNQGDSRSI
jgi:nucleoside-diphosphate-sugar epimerase